MLFSVSILISRCRVILKWLEDWNSVNYWEVCNRHCRLELSNNCPDTILSTLLLSHLKMITFFFLFSSTVSVFVSLISWGLLFSCLFLIKHIAASHVSPFYGNIDGNLRNWNKLYFHWQLTEKHSEFIRLVGKMSK